MRILVGTDTFYPDINGGAYFTQRLATQLSAKGHQVTVACPSLPSLAKSATPNVTIYSLRSFRTPFHPTFRVAHVGRYRMLADAITTVSPDVIHIQTHFAVGRALAILATRKSIPLVATNHFMPENILHYLPRGRLIHQVAHSLMWKDAIRILRLARSVTTPTETAAELLRLHRIGRPIRVISCGVDIERFSPVATKNELRMKLGIGSEVCPVILFVGRLEPEKRVPDLIRAFALTNCITAMLVIVGEGSEGAQLRRQARELDVERRVRFAGFVPDAVLPDYYAMADIFCMPSKAELQSIATLEAMASGLPIVAANAVALPELVRDRFNGFLVECSDIDTLTDRLNRLLASQALRTRMGHRSRQVAIRHRDEHTAVQFEALYDETMQGAQTLRWPLSS